MMKDEAELNVLTGQIVGVQIDGGYRLDLLVDEQVIIEIKAVDALVPLHTAQLLSYLRLTSCPIG